MNKSKPGGGGGDRKGEGEGPRMLTSQTPPGLVPSRPALSPASQGHPYIVQPSHGSQHPEVKNFSKLTRPIAPAPPSQAVQSVNVRNVQASQPNIPSIISSSLGSAPTEGLVSLNLVSSTPSSALGSVSLPVTLSQASVLHLGSSTPAGNTTTGLQGSAGPPSIPINMLRGAAVGQSPQAQIQTFAPTFAAHLPRAGTTALPVPKSAAILRPGPAPAIQIPGQGISTGVTPLSLPIARPPLLQTVKTTTAQAARSQSPAVGGQPAPQAQPQDLSRTNFALHGTITTTATLGPHPMHITLNRMNTPLNSDLTRMSTPLTQELNRLSAPLNQDLNRIVVPLSQEAGLHNNRTVQPLVQAEATGGLQQRISVSLSSDGNIQARQGEFMRAGLTLNAHGKVTQQPLGTEAKAVASQSFSQHGATIKTVNLAATTPVLINSASPSLTVATTTIASAAPIPIAKVPPQRQQMALGNVSMPPTSIPAQLHTTVAATPHSVASSAPSLPSVSASMLSTLRPATPASTPSSAMTSDPPSTPAATTQGLATGGMLLQSDLQPRPPGSIITLATSLTSSVPAGVTVAGSVRGERPSSQQMGIGPENSMWYQHFVYQQSSQPQLVGQAAPTIVRPTSNTFATFLPSQGKIPNSSSGLAASQLAHAISVASSTNVRFNPSMMVVDQLRQQQQHQQQQAQPQALSLHSAFSTGTTTTASNTGEKTILAPHELLINAAMASRSSVASSVYTASVGVQSQMASSLSAVPVSNPSSSPRPSILRKRTSEATGVIIRKPNFNLNQDNRCHSPPRVEISTPSVSSPKTPSKNLSPMSENSQSSTDTALSSNDATTPTHNHNDKGSKGDAEECVENGPVSSVSVVNNIPASPAVSNAGSLSEASPRKRARKQLLHANEELKDNLSSSEEELENPSSRLQDDSSKETGSKVDKKKGEYTDEDGVRWVFNKPRPSYVLIQPEHINNKTKHNHFVRYTEVKPKEERRPTVNELSNQRGISQKVNGWKLYFTASQLEELMEVERDMQSIFTEVQSAFSQISKQRLSHEDTSKVHEMAQANIQRCQLLQNQLSEARTSMIKTLEHKPRIQEIVNKHMSKRPIKKKERT